MSPIIRSCLFWTLEYMFKGHFFFRKTKANSGIISILLWVESIEQIFFRIRIHNNAILAIRGWSQSDSSSSSRHSSKATGAKTLEYSRRFLLLLFLIKIGLIVSVIPWYSLKWNYAIVSHIHQKFLKISEKIHSYNRILRSKTQDRKLENYIWSWLE